MDDIEFKQKIILIMSNIVMSGKIAKNEPEKIRIIKNSLSFLTKKMNWQEEINIFCEDLFIWLKETRNYYRHFWDGSSDKEKSKDKKDKIEQKEYIKRIKNREEKHNFKNIIKSFIFKNNLPENILNEDFDIALLSIFTNKYEKNRIIKAYELNNGDIFDLLTMKNMNRIFLYKSEKEEYLFPPKSSPTNEILDLLNEDKLKNNNYNLSFLKNDINKRIRHYFNKRNKDQLIELHPDEGYSISNKENIFQIENTKYFLNEKYLLNVFLLFCIEEEKPSFNWNKAISNFTSNIYENEIEWKKQLDSFKETKQTNNKKSFMEMLKHYYDSKDKKHNFIKHSLKFLHNYWKNTNSKKYLIHIFDNINTIENIKKYIYHDDFDKLFKLLNHSEDYKSKFLKELNIKNSNKKIIDFIYEYIENNIENFLFKNKEKKFIEKKNSNKKENDLKIMRFHLAYPKLIDTFSKQEKIEWKKLKKGKTNKIILAYFFLIKQFLNDKENKNSNKKINKILLEKSFFKNIKINEEYISHKKEVNKKEIIIIKNRPIQQSPLFKSLYKRQLFLQSNKEETFQETMEFYKWYEQNEFSLIDKVKNINIEKEWSEMTKKEKTNKNIINLIMHREAGKIENLVSLKKDLEEILK